MNNSVFGKTMENLRKHRDIKLVTTDKRRNQLVSQPNCHTENYFSENLLAIQMKKKKLKSVLLEISPTNHIFLKTFMSEWGGVTDQ